MVAEWTDHKQFISEHVTPRTRSISEDEEKKMVDIQKADPFITEKEIALKVSSSRLEMGAPPISQQSVSRKLKDNNFSTKEVRIVSEDRNSPRTKRLRLEKFQSRPPDMTMERTICVDETIINFESHPKYGRSPIGQPVTVQIPHDYLKFAPALTIYTAMLPTHGIIHHFVDMEHMNKDGFVTFLDGLMQLVSEGGEVFREPKYYVLMDGASFHKGMDIEGMFEGNQNGKEFKLWINPPYSPMLNPIEEAFHQFKSSNGRSVKSSQLTARATGDIQRSVGPGQQDQRISKCSTSVCV